LSDGDTIDMSETGRNPEVEEVLGALSFLLSGGGVAQLGTITREANLVMSGREDRLRSMLGALEGVVGTLDQQKADIIHALESLDNLATTLNAEKDTIGEALDAVGPAVEVLADQHDELIDMLSALDRLGEVGTRVINASKEDVLAMLEELAPILNGLKGAGKKLAPGLNLLVSFPFPKAANSIVQGDYADTIARLELDRAAVRLPGVGERDDHPVAELLDDQGVGQVADVLHHELDRAGGARLGDALEEQLVGQEHPGLGRVGGGLVVVLRRLGLLAHLGGNLLFQGDRRLLLLARREQEHGEHCNDGDAGHELQLRSAGSGQPSTAIVGRSSPCETKHKPV
jgi:hypothetical protein